MISLRCNYKIASMLLIVALILSTGCGRGMYRQLSVEAVSLRQAEHGLMKAEIYHHRYESRGHPDMNFGTKSNRDIAQSQLLHRSESYGLITIKPEDVPPWFGNDRPIAFHLVKDDKETEVYILVTIWEDTVNVGRKLFYAYRTEGLYWVKMNLAEVPMDCIYANLDDPGVYSAYVVDYPKLKDQGFFCGLNYAIKHGYFNIDSKDLGVSYVPKLWSAIRNNDPSIASLFRVDKVTLAAFVQWVEEADNGPVMDSNP